MKSLLESIRNMYASEATMMQDDGKVVHNCAKHVEHAEYGQGATIAEEHADPDEHGNIAWYDVMFEHGIERAVPTQSLKILQAETHMHTTKKAKKVSEGNVNAPASIDPKQAIKKKAMDDALDAANKQATGPGPVDPIVHQGTNEDFDAEIAALNLSETEIQEIEEAYMGMKKLTSQLKARGATNAPGLAAWIGRKKYGKKKFQAAAAKGQKLGEEAKDDDEKLEDDDVKAAGHKKTKERYETMSKMPERDVKEAATKPQSKDEKDKVVRGVQAAMLKSHGNVIAGRAQLAAARVAAKVKSGMKEEIDFPINEEYDDDQPAAVDETIIAATKEYDISEAQKSSGYDAHFRAMMAKHGIRHPGELDTPEKKKAFFNKVDASYKAKNEDVFLEAMMASDLQKIKDAHRSAGNKISDEKSGSKAGQAHHSFVVTQPSGKRTRHIYHGSTKKVETMSPAPRSKESSEQDLDDK